MRYFEVEQNKPAVVTFTGGMGAQIISAAIYFSMKNEGSPVYADLSYFEKPESVAVVGKAGDCSHWSWQLKPFGLSFESFITSSGLNKRNANLLKDGPRKLELGLKALAQPEVQKSFEISASINGVLSAQFEDDFLCVHVRRGDYVNVASHLVADSEFISLSKKFAGLISTIVVLSDSPIDENFRNALSSNFKVVSFMDNTDAYTAHCIMRKARVLICSNSQFSLVAAALNNSALVLVPKQWFGGKDSNVETSIQSRCLFQIMDIGAQ